MKRKMVVLMAMVAMMASAAWAGDTSALHPPAGSRMALVVFEDLECPACAKADPLLTQAERNYGMPLVRHDFVIPNHAWSMEAHIMARYFDTQSPQVGRRVPAIYFCQPDMRSTRRTCGSGRITLPRRTTRRCLSFYDPTGALRAKVEADTELGRAMGVHQTPTIYVVSNSPQVPLVEVTDMGKLFETIEQVKAALGPAPAAKSKKKAMKPTKKLDASARTAIAMRSAWIGPAMMARARRVTGVTAATTRSSPRASL